MELHVAPGEGAWRDSCLGRPRSPNRRRSHWDSPPSSSRLPSSSRVPHRVVELGDGRHDGVVVLAPIHLRAASPQLVPPVRGAHGRSGASEQLLLSGYRPERLRDTLCACRFMRCQAASGRGASPPASPAPGCTRPLPALQTRPGPAPGSPGARRPRPPGAGPDRQRTPEDGRSGGGGGMEAGTEVASSLPFRAGGKGLYSRAYPRASRLCKER